MREWAQSMERRRVVPERGAPTMKKRVWERSRAAGSPEAESREMGVRSTRSARGIAVVWVVMSGPNRASQTKTGGLPEATSVRWWGIGG